MTSLVKYLGPCSDFHVTGALQWSLAGVKTWVAFSQAAQLQTDRILPMPHPRSRLKRRVLDSKRLTGQSNKPLILCACMYGLCAWEGTTKLRSGGNAEIRGECSPLVHTYQDVACQPAVRAWHDGRRDWAGRREVRQSGGRCEGVYVLCGTPEWCGRGMSTAIVTVAKAARVVCACILKYGRERVDGASSSEYFCVRTGALRRPLRIPVGGRWWRRYVRNT